MDFLVEKIPLCCEHVSEMCSQGRRLPEAADEENFLHWILIMITCHKNMLTTDVTT